MTAALISIFYVFHLLRLALQIAGEIQLRFLVRMFPVVLDLENVLPANRPVTQGARTADKRQRTPRRFLESELAAKAGGKDAVEFSSALARARAAAGMKGILASRREWTETNSRARSRACGEETAIRSFLRFLNSLGWSGGEGRGRDAGCPAPPARIRT